MDACIQLNVENLPPDCESFDFYKVVGNNWQCAAVVGVNELFYKFDWNCTTWNMAFFYKLIYFQLPINFSYPLNSGGTRRESAIRLHDAFKSFDKWYQENGCENNTAIDAEQRLLSYMKEEFEDAGGNVTIQPPSGFSGSTTYYKSVWFGYGDCN